MSRGFEAMDGREPGRRPARRTFRDRFFRKTPKNAAALSYGESADVDEAWIPSSGPLVAPRREHWIPSSGPLVAPRRGHIPSSGPPIPHSAVLLPGREDGAEERARVRLQQRSRGKESHQTSRMPRRTRSGKPSSSKDRNNGWNPLRENWREVVTTVLSVDFDNLVDLEEFFGYYLLLSSDVYRELVEHVFKEFCDDFSLPLERLMVSRQLPNYDHHDDSDKEVEFLPPSPCSRRTLAWLQKMDQDLLERR